MGSEHEHQKLTLVVCRLLACEGNDLEAPNPTIDLLTYAHASFGGRGFWDFLPLASGAYSDWKHLCLFSRLRGR